MRNDSDSIQQTSYSLGLAIHLTEALSRRQPIPREQRRGN